MYVHTYMQVMLYFPIRFFFKQDVIQKIFLKATHKQFKNKLIKYPKAYMYYK